MTSRLATPGRRLTTGAVVGVAGFVTGVLIFFTLTGCSGNPANQAAASGTTQTASAQSVQQQAQAVYLDFARCVRSHGDPGFPDPQVIDSQGHADFHITSVQAKQASLRAQSACGAILNRLPASARDIPPITPAELQAERVYAACLRRHGLPNWPDPRPDGTFALSGTPYANAGKTGPVAVASGQCRQYETFGPVRGS